MKLNHAGRQLIERNPEPIYDVDAATEIISYYVRIELNENQYSALMSLVCSMTENNFRTSDLLGFLNAGEFDEALEIYDKYGSHRSMFLRDDEISLFKEFPIVGGTDVKNIA